MKTATILTAEQRTALDHLAAKLGRNWKRDLCLAWEASDYRSVPLADDNADSVLQGLRNASYFGPRGLVKYRATV